MCPLAMGHLCLAYNINPFLLHQSEHTSVCKPLNCILCNPGLGLSAPFAFSS
jgi:hypothetical protein